MSPLLPPVPLNLGLISSWWSLSIAILIFFSRQQRNPLEWNLSHFISIRAMHDNERNFGVVFSVLCFYFSQLRAQHHGTVDSARVGSTFEYEFCHFLPGWLWASLLIALRYNDLIWKIVIVLPSRVGRLGWAREQGKHLMYNRYHSVSSFYYSKRQLPLVEECLFPWI